jgi:catechol 2,3-dioxygenase-like lactoylglutathione lyase family enzyme
MSKVNRPSHAGLRHVALNARHLDAMKQFYVDLLGFEIEWQPDADNIYLSSGVDNLALHRSKDAPGGGSDGAPKISALDHVGLIVRSAGDVDQWAEFLESRGVALDAKPRTHRDGARSCYFRDPDGNAVQIIHHPPISHKV